MPTPYLKEFRADGVAVARQGDKSRAQGSLAASASASPAWLAGHKSRIATTRPQNRELRRRTKQLEQENEILLDQPQPAPQVADLDRFLRCRPHSVAVVDIGSAVAQALSVDPEVLRDLGERTATTTSYRRDVVADS